jgi:hypothetical protein
MEKTSKHSVQHTPGPWSYDDSRKYYSRRVVRMNGVIVCAMGEHGIGAPDEHEITANARLIAKAPELLAALRGILDNQSPLGDGYTQVCTLDVEAAERIIAEIEGEES